MKVKTILITVREDGDELDLAKRLPRDLKLVGGGKCLISYFSGFHIMLHGLGHLFSRNYIHFYEGSPVDSRLESPDDGPPKP